MHPRDDNNNTERRLDSMALTAQPEDLSLVLGGPLYQLWRRLHMAGPALELLARQERHPPGGLAAAPGVGRL